MTTAGGAAGEQVSIPIWLEMLAVVVASVSGVLTAREHKLDFIGAIGLAVACGLGGGIIRDVILQKGAVYILDQPLALPMSVATAAIAFVFPVIFEKPDRLIAILDIFSVGLYAAVGADKSMVYELSPMVCVMMGFFTAVGGGMLRDVFLGQTPGIFQRGKTALTVGGRDYSVTDVNYYFTYYMNQAYSTSGGAFDPSKDLRTQYTDEEQTKSYFDQFLDSTIEQLKKISALETAASEAGYTLSDDDKAYVDEAISSTKKAAESYGYAYDGYLKAMYGKYMTPSAFKTCVEREALVNGYQSAYADSLGITDEDIQAYYEENASTLDTYDYRYIYLSGKAASTTDEDGNTVEPTEEETKAAMEAAKAKADAFVAAVNSSDDKETAFAELAPDYVSEDDKEDYEADPDASLHPGTVGSSLSYQSFGKWLMDDSRANGDVGVVESSSGYYAVMLLNRYRDETATADIRHILIKAEVADADDPATEDVDESKVPTQEALDAAKAEAEDILAQWEAGDKTAESFGALAEEYSDDPASNTNGGLYEQVAPGVMFEGFNDWIFADGRAIGDTGLVENPQDGQQGWHIIYLEGWDEPVWKLTGKNALTNEKLNTWLEGLTENMEATQGAGVKYLGE